MSERQKQEVNLHRQIFADVNKQKIAYLNTPIMGFMIIVENIPENEALIKHLHKLADKAKYKSMYGGERQDEKGGEA